MTTILPIRSPVAIAADHRGFTLKSAVIEAFAKQGFTFADCGTDNTKERVDVMDYVLKAVKQIEAGEAERAILVCGSGIMPSLVANRFAFIRAAACMSAAQAEAGRSHNDINVLCLAADFTDEEEAMEIVEAFLDTPTADDPRYEARRQRLATFDPAAFLKG